MDIIECVALTMICIGLLIFVCIAIERKLAKAKPEIKVLVCRKCGESIDQSFYCGFDCEDDGVHVNDRLEEYLEYQVFCYSRRDPFHHEEAIEDE
ncbi:MAG: hypothetical protein WCT49_02350 [Candidatus Paceibacterota bacterium]|jgi:hypothetical protein|nr:hypothetical protein [Candidatus Paceibacterota bacterium]